MSTRERKHDKKIKQHKADTRKLKITAETLNSQVFGLKEQIKEATARLNAAKKQRLPKSELLPIGREIANLRMQLGALNNGKTMVDNSVNSAVMGGTILTVNHAYKQTETIQKKVFDVVDPLELRMRAFRIEENNADFANLVEDLTNAPGSDDDGDEAGQEILDELNSQAVDEDGIPVTGGIALEAMTDEEYEQYLLGNEQRQRRDGTLAEEDRELEIQIAMLTAKETPTTKPVKSKRPVTPPPIASSSSSSRN